MAWVQIQKAAQVGWDDYQRVQDGLGDDVPEGLICHAAGVQENGRWQAVSIWESEDHFNRFRDNRLLPVVREALGGEVSDAGPPPTESFEAKHLWKA